MILEGYKNITDEKLMSLFKNYYNCHTGLRKGLREKAREKNLDISSSSINLGSRILHDYQHRSIAYHLEILQEIVTTPCENDGDFRSMLPMINNYILTHDLVHAKGNDIHFYDQLLYRILPFKLDGISLINQLEISDRPEDEVLWKYTYGRLELLYLQFMKIIQNYCEVQYNGRLKNASIILYLFMGLLGLEVRDIQFIICGVNAFSWDSKAGDIIANYIENYKLNQVDTCKLMDELEGTGITDSDFLDWIRKCKKPLLPNYDRNKLVSEVYDNTILFGDNIIPVNETVQKFVYQMRELDLPTIQSYDENCTEILPISESALCDIKSHYPDAKYATYKTKDAPGKNLLGYNGSTYLLYQESETEVRGISVYPTDGKNRSIITIPLDTKYTYHVAESEEVRTLSYGGI